MWDGMDVFNNQWAFQWTFSEFNKNDAFWSSLDRNNTI